MTKEIFLNNNLYIMLEIYAFWLRFNKANEVLCKAGKSFQIDSFNVKVFQLGSNMEPMLEVVVILSSRDFLVEVRTIPDKCESSMRNVERPRCTTV